MKAIKNWLYILQTRTGRHWFKKLSSDDVRRKFTDAFLEQRGPEQMEKHFNMRFRTKRSFLSGSFAWDMTKDGFGFWSDERLL